jgi:voltage-gated potassium channel Kch
MREVTTSPGTHKSNWYQWTLVALTLLTLVFGFTGYMKYEQACPAGHAWDVMATLYDTLQLLIANGQHLDGEIPWQLHAGRLTGVALLFTAALVTFMKFFRQEVLFFRIHLPWRRNHIVVCGLGRKGMQIVQGSLAQGKRVVVIERDPHNDLIRVAEEEGALVILGDATDSETLNRVLVHRAECVFATCGDDGSNVEIAAHVSELRSQLPMEKRRHLDCWLHIVDPVLCEALKVHGKSRNKSGDFTIRVVNIFENSARIALADNPLDREHIGHDDPRTITLAIVGFGQMGQAIARQAAKIGHYANGRKLQLNIVDREADRHCRSFMAQYPQFDQICETKFITSDYQDSQFFRDLHTWAAAPDSLLTIAICLDNDSASLKCALAIATQLEDHPVPILMRMEEEAGLTSLLRWQGQDHDLLRHVRAFGQIDVAASLEKWLSPDQDTLARMVHDSFRKLRAEEGRLAEDPSMRDWNELDEALRESNRQFADHIPAKLRAIRCTISEPPSDGKNVRQFTKSEADILARMEHARWNAERFLAGWKLGPVDKAHKISPYLVSWEKLPPEIQKYDYQLNELIPELVSKMGKRILRIGEM